MRGRYTEYDNVADFTVYKITRLIADMQYVQRHDIVEILQDAIDSYLKGNIDIAFRDGWPYIAESEGK